MVRPAARLLAGLLSWSALVPAMAGAAAPSDPAALSKEASYQFAIAKALASEGEMQPALEAYEKAEDLAPDAPYILVDHAQFLARVAQSAQSADEQRRLLRSATDKVERARRLAPENPDVLRAVGAIYLDLSAQDPGALAKAMEAFEAVYRQGRADPQMALVLGRLYLDQGQAEKSVEVLSALSHNLPQNRTVYLFLVEALMRAEKMAEAERTLRDLLAFAPESLEARLTLADLQSRRGDNQAAAQTLSAAPESVRADPRIGRQLAWALYLSGDLAGALRTVEPLLGSEPGDRRMSLLKGLVLAAEGRNGEAADLLIRVRQAQPDDSTLARSLAQVLQRAGRNEEATAVLADVAGRLAKAGKTEEERTVRLDLAQAWFDMEKWDQGVQALAPLLAAEPAVRTEALLLQADALLRAKRYDEALGLLVRASDTPQVVSKRAEVLMRAGREREAEELLARIAVAPGGAATIDRQDVLSILAAAQAYQRAERYEASIPLLQRLQQLHPDDLGSGFLLGTAYERTGRHQEAITLFRRLLEIQPDFHAALNYLGYIWAERGENLEEALSLARRAVALAPDNGAYVDSLGWAYYRLGRFEQAREALERAARLEPGDATLQEHLGDVYVALGQTDKALEVYRRALELGDDNAEQVRRKLDRLQASPRSR
ncbi:MAG TPA: tetratricopeptide repeat protein [Thermoanaerobaculia bacterium]|nr:tetratricopeptide repeat protein [Thermoanaerobaculia bacterium]